VRDSTRQNQLRKRLGSGAKLIAAGEAFVRTRFVPPAEIIRRRSRGNQEEPFPNRLVKRGPSQTRICTTTYYLRCERMASSLLRPNAQKWMTLREQRHPSRRFLNNCLAG
jgi:hypothetical protein